MAASFVTRRRALLGVALVFALLAFGGRYLARAGEPRAYAPPPAATAVAPPPAPEVVVDVVGAVRRPGLYRMHQGDRIADAVARAGGVTRRADPALVNLAAPLADGEQIVVPARAAAGSGAAAAGSAAASGPVHLDTATAEQLDALPGVGPVTAQKILAYRQEHGAFGSVDAAWTQKRIRSSVRWPSPKAAVATATYASYAIIVLSETQAE